MPNEHVLTPTVKIDGQEKIGGENIAVGTKLRRLQVDQRLDCPDFFSVEYHVKTSGQEQKLVIIDDVKLGMEVEIAIGYKTPATIFKGEVSYIEPKFAEDESTVSLSGYDLIHRLTRGTSSRTWGDGFKAQDKLGDLAAAVIGDSKARKGGTSDSLSADTESGKSKVEYLPQVEVNDFQFIQSLGVSTGFKADTRSQKDAKKVKFKAVDITADPVVIVYRHKLEDSGKGTFASQADFSLSSVRQVAMVEVRGWDPGTKKAILGKATSVSNPFDGTTGPSAAGDAHYGSGSSGRVLTMIDYPVKDEAEATEIAQSIMDNLALEYSRAEIVCEGRPDVAAGDVIEVSQFGKMFDGKYLVEACTHVYDAEDKTPYQIRLSCIRNAAPS